MGIELRFTYKLQKLLPFTEVQIGLPAISGAYPESASTKSIRGSGQDGC